MRHGAVSYFDEDGRPVPEDSVPLTAEGRAQALATRELYEGVELDRVVASPLPRTQETAALVAPGHEAEIWPELRELKGGKLSEIPLDEREEAFVHAFRGVARLTALVVAHGAVNRAILSWALTGERSFLGRFEQAPCCVNVLDVTHGGEPDWIVRAVNVAASDLAHRSTRQTTMEQYWAQYRAAPDEGPPDTA